MTLDILIIEDELPHANAIRREVSRSLQSRYSEIKFKTVSTVVDALDAFAEGVFQVVMLDWKYLGEKFLAAVGFKKARGVILMSAHNPEEAFLMKDKAFQEARAHYPFYAKGNVRDLLSSVGAVLDEASAQDLEELRAREAVRTAAAWAATATEWDQTYNPVRWRLLKQRSAGLNEEEATTLGRLQALHLAWIEGRAPQLEAVPSSRVMV